MITRVHREEPLAWVTKGVALAIILVGTTSRVGQYLADRSLWLDEAMLALNIANRSLAGLAQPLDYDQGAPLGFLLVEKLTVQAFGNEDYILRLIPLAAGILSLYLVYKVAAYYTPARLHSSLWHCLLSLVRWCIMPLRSSSTPAMWRFACCCCCRSGLYETSDALGSIEPKSRTVQQQAKRSQDSDR